MNRDDSRDLKEALRAGASDDPNVGIEPANLTMGEAADTIEALETRVTKLRNALYGLKENATDVWVPSSVIHAICDSALEE